MKFMLLMQCTQNAFSSLAAWQPAELKAHVECMHELNRELVSSGEFVLAEGLDVPANTRIVRAQRAEAPIVSDGPFAETKEFLAGFWLIEVDSFERAVAIAAKASTAPGPGGRPLGIPIELRQVMSAPDV